MPAELITLAVLEILTLILYKMPKIEIVFHNKTTRITSATVTVNNKKFTFKGQYAKDLAKLANDADKDDTDDLLKTFIDNLL